MSLKNLDILIESSTKIYMELFNLAFKLLKNYPNADYDEKITQKIKECIYWAQQMLKRQDRIYWYLNIVRNYYVNEIINNILEDDDVSGTAYDKLKKIRSKIDSSINHSGQHNVYAPLTNHWREEIVHYFSMNIPKIQNYIWGKESWDSIKTKFKNFEEEWSSKFDGLIPIKKGDDIFLDLGEYKWIYLDQQSCDEEAKAMGHCGNAGSQNENDRILSLRSMTEVEGIPHWNVHLTFIWDPTNGLIGEMKGKKNNKPSEKYHPQIIELLKQEKIKGIKGGGYMPENNFCITDLSKDQQQEIFKHNKMVMPLIDQFDTNGGHLTQQMILIINSRLSEYDINYSKIKYNKSTKKFLVETFKNPYDLASDMQHYYNYDFLTYYLDIIDNDGRMPEEFNNSDYVEHFEYLAPHKLIDAIQNFGLDKYKTDDLEDLMELDEDIGRMIQWSISEVVQRAHLNETENELMKILNSINGVEATYEWATFSIDVKKMLKIIEDENSMLTLSEDNSFFVFLEEYEQEPDPPEPEKVDISQYSIDDYSFISELPELKKYF